MKWIGNHWLMFLFSSKPIQVNQTIRLARQVNVIRWVIPVILFGVVSLTESLEHLIFKQELDFGIPNFSFEIMLFGVVGPLLIFFALSLIVRDLHLLADAHEEIQTFNETLEARIEERTGELARANAELRQLDQMKSDFVSLVSHELRAPLTNIHGGLELLLQRSQVDPAQTRKTLTVVQDEVRRLRRLVSQILDISRLDAGQLQLNQGPVMLRPLLQTVVTRSLDASPNHRLTLDLPTNLSPIWGDEDRLTDVFINLLTNAFKYSPEESAVRVEATEQTEGVHVTVRDRGIGIDPAAQPHLFDMFYRSEEAEQHGVQGYGLGLYLCRKIIDAHHGRIWAESTGIPGEGATFHLLLPIDDGQGDMQDDTNFAH